MYENLTRYLQELTSNDYGLWVVDNKNDGTPENPLQVPYVNYSSIVDRFVGDIYSFVDSHKEMGLNNYSEILDKNGIEWNADSMTTAKVETLDGTCILALLLGAVRMERFCDGALLSFFEDGSIERWLLRLQELDSACETN